MTKDLEIPLTGGRNTEGVVRVGDTVRRPIRPNTDFLHNLLGHLEVNGFNGSPRVLGIDDKNREVLTFIEGVPASKFNTYTDIQIEALAKLIREFHDIASMSELCGDQETIAHSDLAPSNVIFKNDVPICFIDFDCARPASRAFDLGYTAWKFLRFGEKVETPEKQSRKMHLFVKAYGDIEVEKVFENILLRQERHIRQGKENNKLELEQEAEHAKSWCLKHRDTLLNKPLP